MDRNILKLAAYVLMIFDHVAAIFYPSELCLRVPGRLAMPIFCFLGVVGLQKSKDVAGYLSGLVLLGFVSQYPYYFAFGLKSPNDMLFLAGSMICVYLANQKKSIIPILIGMGANYVVGYVGGALLVLVAHIANEFKSYIPDMTNKTKVHKYWMYSMYPGHLMILAGIRNITQ